MFKVIEKNTKTNRTYEIVFDTEQEAKDYAFTTEMCDDYAVCYVRPVEA